MGRYWREGSHHHGRGGRGLITMGGEGGVSSPWEGREGSHHHGRGGRGLIIMGGQQYCVC